MRTKKFWIAALAAMVCGAITVSAVSAAEVNTLPSYVFFSTHAAMMGKVIIDETEPGVNSYTLTSSGQNDTPMLFSYDKELTIPKEGFGEDSIRFSFNSSLPQGQSVVNDFFFNFGFRLSSASLPSWNQTFGIYLTFYPAYGGKEGRVVFAVCDGAPLGPDTTDPLYLPALRKAEGYDYMDGLTHTVEITVDSEAFKVDVFIDKGTEAELAIAFQSDKIADTPDQFDPTGGYSFMAHGSRTVITDFAAVDSTKSPQPPAEPSPKPSEQNPPSERPSTGPTNKPGGSRGGGTGLWIALGVVGGVVVAGGITAAVLIAVKRRKKG